MVARTMKAKSRVGGTAGGTPPGWADGIESLPSSTTTKENDQWSSRSPSTRTKLPFLSRSKQPSARRPPSWTRSMAV